MPIQTSPRQDAAQASGRGPAPDAACTSFEAEYRRESVAALLAQRRTLAAFGFQDLIRPPADPRYLRVALPALDPADAPNECWTVAADVVHGSDGALRWSRGGGWRFVAIETDEREADIERATRDAYARLLDDVAASPEPHLVRIWNYLYAINEGTGNAERYRRFCVGRAASIASAGLAHYPAATAIGHHGIRGRLQIYALCARRDGTALENPRQVSAWNYPRQYGPTSPQFARAMRLPGGALAISGTAAIVGHASHYPGDAAAQADEAFTNVATLVREASLPPLDDKSLLKVYVRNPDDLPAIRATLGNRIDPAVPRVFLQGDVCRRELLVEMEAWR